MFPASNTNLILEFCEASQFGWCAVHQFCTTCLFCHGLIQIYKHSITSPQHLKLIKILGVIYEQEILIKSLVQGVKPSRRDILFFKFNTLTVQDMYKTCTSHVFQHKIADKATSVRLCIDIFKKNFKRKNRIKGPI